MSEPTASTTTTATATGGFDLEAFIRECPSQQGGSGIAEVLPPSNRSQAATYPRTPEEAALRVRDGRMFDRGTLTGPEVVGGRPGEYVFSVVDDGDRIGMISVSAARFGTFVATRFATCSP